MPTGIRPFMRRYLFNVLLTLSLLPIIASAQGIAPPAPCPSCLFEPQATALEKLLSQYKQLAENGGWPTWIPGKKLKPHEQDARIPILRQMLTITGDYTALSGAPAAPLKYDDTLADAVKRFQLRHGLNADAALGKATQTALAIPVEGRIAQITETITRIRGHGLPPEPRYIFVNLPAFTLTAVENGTAPLTMRVIIGDRKNHTPLFDNAITDVIFNPQWHVPERIAKNELVPKLRKDPDYFIHAGFVVTRDGVPVDPAHLPEGDDFSFRQVAGDENALGKIKFDMTDPENIYLHSTAAPKLFTKDDRALSHGCIRVENPLALAHFVMNGTKGWDKDRIDTAYGSDKHRWVKVEETPVHLVYWTAFVDAGGGAHFFNDLYDMNNSTAQ